MAFQANQPRKANRPRSGRLLLVIGACGLDQLRLQLTLHLHAFSIIYHHLPRKFLVLTSVIICYHPKPGLFLGIFGTDQRQGLVLRISKPGLSRGKFSGNRSQHNRFQLLCPPCTG